MSRVIGLLKHDAASWWPAAAVQPPYPFERVSLRAQRCPVSRSSEAVCAQKEGEKRSLRLCLQLFVCLQLFLCLCYWTGPCLHQAWFTDSSCWCLLQLDLSFSSWMYCCWLIRELLGLQPLYLLPAEGSADSAAGPVSIRPDSGGPDWTELYSCERWVNIYAADFLFVVSSVRPLRLRCFDHSCNKMFGSAGNNQLWLFGIVNTELKTYLFTTFVQIKIRWDPSSSFKTSALKSNIDFLLVFFSYCLLFLQILAVIFSFAHL